LLWSEGTRNYALSIALQHGDEEHLRTLEQDLRGSRSPERDLRYGRVRLVWRSKYLAQQLINLGIPPRKSGCDFLPSFPAALAQHFWRGVFDGDGCLAVQIKGPNLAPVYRLSLAGSHSMLVAF
jgi:hypothetical protein